MGDVPAQPSAGVTDLKARIEAERAGRPFLLYMDGQDRQRLFYFEPGMTHASVGRQESSDLVLGFDEQVSRLHARFERVGEDWAVVDDGLSRNGTFVNGERMRGRHRLADGDSLRIGATTMTFRSPRADEQPGPGVADDKPPAVDLSTTQRRVLAALARPYKDGNAFASPATDEQIAEEVFLSVDSVKTHLRVLYAKVGVDDQPPDQKRIRLVERAFYGGLIAEGDL
jgi:FHA domain-containing protein